jgi:hypothetical protein
MSKKVEKKTRIKGEGTLSGRVGRSSSELVISKILEARKVRDDGSRLTDPDGVDFDEIEYGIVGAKLFIHPRHVTVDEVSSHARSSCKDCNGKGYSIINIAKAILNNPSQYTILSQRSLEGLDEEQSKQIIEEEKQRSTWRVLLPCYCALRRAREKIPNFFANKDGSITFAVDWEEEREEVEEAS